MKLSKKMRKDHDEALALLAKGSLSWEEQMFFFDHYHEGANNEIGRRGAFFTPTDLALDTVLEAGQTDKEITIIDLCAGIGVLSWAALTRCPNAKVTAIEQNPEWVEIGKKLLPQVNWICADIREIDWSSLGEFDLALTNPPFGNVPTLKGFKSPRYTGSESHYKVLDIASLIADELVAILPQTAAPWKYSGTRCFERTPSDKTRAFTEQTGITLDMNIGIDTSCYSQFKATGINVEVVSCVYERVYYEDVVKTSNKSNVLHMQLSSKPVQQVANKPVNINHKPKETKQEPTEPQYAFGF